MGCHRERGYFTATRPGTGQLPNCKIASVRATAVPRIAAVVGVGKMQSYTDDRQSLCGSGYSNRHNFSVFYSERGEDRLPLQSKHVLAP